jgi:hypothetical protein
MSATKSARAWIAPALVSMLIVAHGVLVWDGIRRSTPTLDEVAHLPAGMTYVEQGTFKLYRHSPPLARLVSALTARPSWPTLTYERSWLQDEPANHWAFAFETIALNAESPASRQRYLDAFTYGRLGTACFSAIALAVLYVWGRQLFGLAGGVVAAGLWALCPNVIAHAGLVTTDVPHASTTLLACYLFWRWLERPTAVTAVGVSAALGAAQLVKFSALGLYAVVPVWWLADRCRRGKIRGRELVLLAGMIAGSVFVINVGYLFEGTGTPLGQFEFLSESLTRPRGVSDGPVAATNNRTYESVMQQRVNRFRGTWLAGIPCPLPFHFVAGFDEQKFEAEGKYPMYLRGRFADPLPAPDALAGPTPSGRRGWWYYYLYALAVKLPIGTQALMLAGVALLLLRRAPRGSWPLLFLGLVPIATMSLLTDINLGLRYVLTALPFLMLLAGSVATIKSRVVQYVLLGSAFAINLGALRHHPHELAYFNEWVGGPSFGRFHLIDSNLDWGQDLRGLVRWLSVNDDWAREVKLAYMGSVPPEFEGWHEYRLAPRDLRFIPDARLLPWENRDDPSTWGPLPGKYAVSVNFERGMRFHTPTPLATFIAFGGRLGNATLGGTMMLECPRGSFAYFQEFQARIEPSVGHSILLYDVSLEEANRVRAKLGLPTLAPR